MRPILPIKLKQVALPNHNGKAADTGSAARYGAGLELVVGDGGALDSAPDQIAVQTVGQVAAIEPVGPLPQVARQMLGADPMMGADQPGFDVAEQRVDDREEFGGIGAVALDHRGVFQILAETGVAAAITGKPIGQQMRIGRHICFKKDPQFGPLAAGSTAMRASPAKNPCWRLTAWPCFALRFFGAGTFSTAATTRLLSGLAVLRPRLVGSPRPPMKVSSASRKPCSGRDRSSLSPWRSLCAMVQAV